MPSQMELEVSGIVQSLLQGSGELQQESSGHLQPNKKVIIGMIEQLQMVLFPEYFVKKRVSQHAAEYYIGSILDEIYINLVDQITLALLQREEFQDADERRRRAEAISIAGQFLTTLPKIQSYLYMDVDAAFDGDPAAFNKDEIIFSYPGLYAIMVNRLAHELHLLKVPLIPRIMTEHAHGLTGIDIHPGATIGKYFFIDHGTGVVIGETTEIGDWVKIYQGVTLGGLSTRAGPGACAIISVIPPLRTGSPFTPAPPSWVAKHGSGKAPSSVVTPLSRSRFRRIPESVSAIRIWNFRVMRWQRRISANTGIKSTKRSGSRWTWPLFFRIALALREQ